MRRQNLQARAARKYKATTNSKHDLPVAPNLLAQNFSASAPNQKWVSDITYLRTNAGLLYLVVIISLFSWLVVGWTMAERMTAELVCEALQMTLWRRQKTRCYCSMSGKGNCYDNTCAESFFTT